MKFEDAIANEIKAHRKGPPCSMGALIGDLDEADRKALQAALDDPKVAHTWIARALTGVGRRMNPDTVARHRRGDCDCG